MSGPAARTGAAAPQPAAGSNGSTARARGCRAAARASARFAARRASRESMSFATHPAKLHAVRLDRELVSSAWLRQPSRRPTTRSTGNSGCRQIRHRLAVIDRSKPAAGALDHDAIGPRGQSSRNRCGSCVKSTPIPASSAAICGDIGGSKQYGLTRRIRRAHVRGRHQRQGIGIAQACRRALGARGDRLHDRHVRSPAARARGPGARPRRSCRRRCRSR